MYAHLISTVTGSCTLPTYEVDRKALDVKRRHIRPFDSATGFKAAGSAPGKLDIDARELMLSAAKTELARSVSFSMIEEQAVGLWIRLKPLLVIDGGPLRLTPSLLFARKDASSSFDAGRVGEGIGHLFMAQRKYVFWDHLPTLMSATLHGQTVTHAERTRIAKVLAGVAYPAEEPDFVCETVAGDIALLECKGSFVKEHDPYSANPSVLRAALHQLRAWAALVTPPASKQFAVGSFLRHDGDNQHEPSMIAWADPPADRRAREGLPPVPRDAIRRGHYGALLALMGFVDEGRDLRLRARRAPRPRRFRTFAIGDRVFVAAPFLPFLRYTAADYGDWDYLLPATVLGLRLELFSAFARALTAPQASLNIADLVETFGYGQVAQVEGVEGRLLADGAFIGRVAQTLSSQVFEFV